jgi:hypothetical protein
LKITVEPVLSCSIICCGASGTGKGTLSLAELSECDFISKLIDIIVAARIDFSELQIRDQNRRKHSSKTLRIARAENSAVRIVQLLHAVVIQAGQLPMNTNLTLGIDQAQPLAQHAAGMAVGMAMNIDLLVLQCPRELVVAVRMRHSQRGIEIVEVESVVAVIDALADVGVCVDRPCGRQGVTEVDACRQGAELITAAAGVYVKGQSEIDNRKID